jgi:hypothetical protein
VSIASFHADIVVVRGVYGVLKHSMHADDRMRHYALVLCAVPRAWRFHGVRGALL